MIISTLHNFTAAINHVPRALARLLFLFVLIWGAVTAKAQVIVTVTNPTNTTPNLQPSYTSLAVAISNLNGVTSVSGPVILTCAASGSETAPAGGYVVNFTAATSAANNIIIDGALSVITAGLQTAGSGNDAVFKIIGSDYVTIRNFTVQENTGNTVTATGATNTMTEWGIALLRATTTDGAQNNSIQNNIISLNKSYANSFAIYSNVRHDATTPATAADISSPAGANNNNKVYGNTISNVNYGIVFVGSGTAANMDVGNDVGGNSSATGNTLTNWGTNTVNSGAFTSVSATMWGIYINHQTGVNVSYNSLTSSTGIVTATLRGIFIDFSAAAPTGTFTNSITNNSITNNSAATSGTFECIRSQGMTSLSTATVNINNNSILNCVISGVSSSSSMVCISNSSAPGILSISNNIISGNTSTSTTGGFTGISNTGAVTSSVTINNNQVGNAGGGAITFSAATSGNLTGIVSSGTLGASATASIQNNDFRGIIHSVAGTGNHTYINLTGLTAANTVATIAGNTFTNLNVNISGTTTFISQSYIAPSTGTKNTNNNSIVTSYVRGGTSGTVTLILDNGASVSGSVSNCQNNNFSNITVSGSSTLTGISYTDGGTAPSKNVTGNILNNWSAGTGTVNAMNFTHLNGVTVLSNNTVTNISGQGSITGITIGSTVNTATSVAIANNIINNLSSTGGSVTGIRCSNTSPVINISSNSINTLSSTGAGAAMNGILITAATTTNIFKNKIYDISGNQTGTTVNGISVTVGTALNIYNNLVGDLRATAATSLNAISGINANGTSSYNVYYNSIYLNATSTSITTFGTSCITFSSGVTSFNSRNNILFNTSIPAQEGTNLAANGVSACLRRSGGTTAVVPSNYTTTSNNNAYWANPAAGTNNHLTYVEGTSTITNPQNTLANMKSFFISRDQGSVQENISWQSVAGSSTDFLKYNIGSASELESGAINIATFTDDYAGTIRQGNAGYGGTGSAPDIGAWELNGIASDLTGPYISYTSLGNNSCLTGRTLSPVIIMDASGVNITPGTRPRLYYRKSTNADIYVDNSNATNGWKYVEATGGGGSPFSFTADYSLLFGGAPVVNDVIYYFVTAQDLAGTPNVSITNGIFAVQPASVVLTAANFPITGSNSFTIINPGLSATVSVGATQAYHSLTEAGSFGLFNAINSGGLSANVFAYIMDANIVESGAVALNNITYNGCGASPYTLTIKPFVTATLTGSSSSGLITINGADNVIIDGSVGYITNSICPPATASRDLTIINTNTGTSSAVVWLQTASGDGATNNVIRNCNIIGNASNTTLIGIGSGSSTIGTGSLGTGNNNNSFENNNIKAVQVGIYSQGAGASNKNTGNIINQNVMNFPTGSSQNIGTAGIFAGFENNITISGNTIGSVSGPVTDVFGIACGSIGISTSAFTGNEVTNAVISYNKIDSIKSAGTLSASGIYVVTATNSGTNLISNNTLTNLGTNGTSGEFGSGIFVGGGAVTTNIYFNSVSMSGTFSGGTQPNFAMAIGGSNPVVNIKNNVLSARAITGSATTLGLGEYAVGFGYNTFTNLVSNNNDFFTSGAEAKFAKTGSLVSGSGTDVSTLAALRTATGQESVSISTDPLFNSLSNLRPLIGSPLSAAGVPAGSITNDILCSTRNVTTPTIGAYEVPADVTNPVISYSPVGNTSCLTDRTISPVTITDASSINITAGTRPRLYYKKSTHADTYVDNTNATNGWKYVEATGAGGSPFSFTINYGLLFGGAPALSDVIQYFVVAQDLAATPNVGISSGTFAIAPASVTLTATAFPISGTVNSYTIVTAGLSGTVSVGATQAYHSLTEAGAFGLFNAINTSGLSSNLFVEIIDASIPETGETALNAINYNGCASGPYQVYIKPSTAVTTTLTGNSATALIKLNGADNVIIDGSNNGTSSKNMTITNTNTASSGNAVLWLASASASDGATNNTIKNCIITGNSGTTTLMGIFCGGTASISTSGNALADNSTNIIQNNTVSKSQYGIFVTGISTTTLSTGLTVTGNTVGTSAAGNGFLTGGIDVRFQTGATISNNDVQNINGAGTVTMQGINLQDSKASAVLANKVHFMNYSGSSTTRLYGITTSTATFNTVGNQSANTYANNIVYDLVSSATSSTWNTSGINNNGGYNDKYYYNSVYLTGQMSAASGPSSTFSNGNATTTTNCPVVDMRNNLFFMKGSSTVATLVYVHYTTLSSYSGSTLNYNNLEGSSSGAAFSRLGFIGNTDYFQLPDWQLATNKEANSISTDPFFASPTNLQLSIGSPCVGAGTPVSVTVDITGLTRNVSTPTIGAYEQAADFTGPVITYTALANLLCTADRTLSPVTITDGSGVNITAGTRPRLYYKKSTNANTYVDNTNATDGWKYVEATGAGGSPFSFTTVYANIFGGVASGDIIQYFVIAQDIAGTANVTVNSGTFAAAPTSVALTAAAFPLTGTINQYTLKTGAFTADVTIGAAGTYTSLTKAGGLFAAINAGGLTANINAVILDATLNEDGTNALNAIDYGCTGGPYTLTIKPAAGVAVAITGSSSAALIKLNGADYVTFNGLNTGGSSLSITNTNTGISSAVIWLASASTTNGATNNTIKNCSITGNSGTTTLAGIISGGSTISSVAAVANSNNTYEANIITRAQYGIAINGPSALQGGTIITQNTIGSPSNTIGFRGISINNETGTSVTGNTVQYVSSINTTAGAGGIILPGSTTAVNISGNTIRNISSSAPSAGTSSICAIYIGGANSSSNVDANTITGISNTNAGGYGARGIIVLGGLTIVSNNVISDVYCYQDTAHAYWPVGINLEGFATGTHVYYNSVNLSGSHQGYASTGGASAALFINTGGGSLDIRNNALVNSYDNSSSANDKSYAIYSTAASGSGFLFIDYNDYFVSGSTGVLGSLNATDITTIAVWRTATGQDVHSISINPLFATTTNLRPGTGSPLVTAGNAISVTTDITGFTRSVTTPTIGAYEQAGDLSGPTITYTVLGNSLCLTDVTLSPVTITDASGVNITAGTRPRLYYKKSTNANTYVDNTNATNGWKFVEATGAGGSPFSFTTVYSRLFGGITTGDIIQYFVLAQDLAGTPNVSISSGTFNTAPTSVALTATAFPLTGTINQYSLPAGIGADVTIGSGGTYTTLTGTGGLFEAINNSGLTANINARIISTAIAEPGTVALNSINYTCGAGPFTLTIKPNAGIAAVLTGTNPNGAIIKLNGADQVTIDGLNSGGSSLSIINTSTTKTSAVVWLASASASDGATNNTIKNCTISGGSNSTTLAGIVAGSGIILGEPAEAANSNNTILANTLKTAQNGIYISGLGAALDQNWTITTNTIGSAIAAEKMTYRGIFIGSVQNMNVSNNSITGIASTSDCSSTMAGIQVGYVVSGGNINSNIISDIKQTNVQGWGSNGIFLAASSPASNLNVYNNAIYDVAGYGFAAASSIDNGYGIMVQSGGGYNIRFNSIRLTTNQADSLATTGAVNISGNMSSANTAEVRNNIFANTQTKGNRYAIYSSATSTAFSTINHNDYYSTGVLGYLGTPRATLSGWQTATGQDANSVAVNPLFISTTNLTLQTGSPMVNAGITIAGITTDITGFTRSTPPSIGAYEYKVVYVAAQIFLQGAYSTGLLRHKDVTATWASVLNTNALNQPYNTAAFGNYAGTESVNAGFFVATGGTTDIVDWVLLELRDAATPSIIIARRAALIREDGMIVDLDGSSAVSFVGAGAGNYFIAIRHRNHLGVRSATAQFVNGTLGSPTSYNFTTSQAQAYQNGTITTNAAMAQDGTVFMLWAGNANQDSYVRVISQAIPPISSDAAFILTLLGGNPNATGGYTPGDINLDGYTRVISQAIPPISSDVAFILSSVLGGNNNATRKEHM
jgi:hypothetical protein